MKKFKIGASVRLNPSSTFRGQDQGTLGKVTENRRKKLWMDWDYRVEWGHGRTFVYRQEDLLPADERWKKDYANLSHS